MIVAVGDVFGALKSFSHLNFDLAGRTVILACP